MVARQFFSGLSPASSWVARPPVLGLVAHKIPCCPQAPSPCPLACLTPSALHPTVSHHPPPCGHPPAPPSPSPVPPTILSHPAPLRAAWQWFVFWSHVSVSTVSQRRARLSCQAPLFLTLGSDTAAIDDFLANFAYTFSNVGRNRLGPLGMHDATNPLLVGRLAEHPAASIEVL
jgi:hypothetical protein